MAWLLKWFRKNDNKRLFPYQLSGADPISIHSQIKMFLDKGRHHA